MNTDDLRAAVAAIRPGDEVTARASLYGNEATVTGKAWEDGSGSVSLGPFILRHDGGLPGIYLTAVLSHTPAAPTEPMGRWAVVTDRHDAVWVRDEHDPARPWQGRQLWDDLVSVAAP